MQEIDKLLHLRKYIQWLVKLILAKSMLTDEREGKYWLSIFYSHHSRNSS